MKKIIALILILTLLVAFGCTNEVFYQNPSCNTDLDCKGLSERAICLAETCQLPNDQTVAQKEQSVLGDDVDEMIVADENEANMMDNSDENTEINSAESALKEFTIHGSSFSFSPSEIRVKVGDRVKINYISDDVGHNLEIDELNLRTDVVSNGGTDTIEFTADRIGSFDMYCSVGQHRDLGMEGQLIVEA